MATQTLRRAGKEYVLVPRAEYEILIKAAEFPPLPAPNANGNYPALEYARASLARDIISARIRAGLTQKELARRAGVRVETLCRIETGKVTPTVASVEKLDRALRAAKAKPGGRSVDRRRR
jgi:DNA-binding XRE family transcriptional regulator